MMKTVVVVGGGITGLCTMHYLRRYAQELDAPIRLILAEKMIIWAVKCILNMRMASLWKLVQIL